MDEARITDQQLSYQKVLNDEMKAFVNSFYMDMLKKISSIRKELQEVVNRKRRAKYKMRIGRSADSSKRDTESSIVVSNQTPRSWTSEKQYEKQKHVVQLVSNNENNELEHSSQRVLLKSFSFLSGYSSKCQEPFCSQTLPNMVISEDDIEPEYSSCEDYKKKNIIALKLNLPSFLSEVLRKILIFFQLQTKKRYLRKLNNGEEMCVS